MKNYILHINPEHLRILQEIAMENGIQMKIIGDDNEHIEHAYDVPSLQLPKRPLSKSEILQGMPKEPTWFEEWDGEDEDGHEAIRRNPMAVFGPHARIIPNEYDCEQTVSKIALSLLDNSPNGEVEVCTAELGRDGWYAEDIRSIREGNFSQVRFRYVKTLEEARGVPSYNYPALTEGEMQKAIDANLLFLVRKKYEDQEYTDLVSLLGCADNCGHAIFSCHYESECVIWVQ